jgi:hypothetical protein
VALTLDAAPTGAIGLEEYLDFVEREVDLDDLDSIAASAPVFAALLENRRLIAAVIDEDLRSWRDYQRGNGYVGQTLLLARRPRFFVRANIWTPPPRSSQTIRKVSPPQYLIPHDHNFSFMTGGYFGSGYATTIYEHEAQRPLARGERAELRFLERTTLPRGKIMLYRAGKDVHAQEHPAEFSISINLIVPGEASRRPQHLFDLERGIVTGHIANERGRYLAVCELAKRVGAPTTIALLGDLAEAAPHPHLRAAAAEAMEALVGGGSR